MQDLEGAQEGFEVASMELEQACRFMLVREPRVVDPIDNDARILQDGAPPAAKGPPRSSHARSDKHREDLMGPRALLCVPSCR